MDRKAQIAAIQTPDWNLVLANPDKYSYATTPPWAALTNSLSLNTALYPTNITAFRQAIVHAINYSDLTQKAARDRRATMLVPNILRGSSSTIRAASLRTLPFVLPTSRWPDRT
jgi:ABC-type transport system substrate-binding protein